MNKNSKIYIAGHKGLVGSSLFRILTANGYSNLIVRDRGELDLLNQKQVQDFFQKEQPEYVFLAAALVGGIMANNTRRAKFIYENLEIQNNLIHNAYLSGVKKLLFLGSSCIYPRNCPQPIKEEYLLTGELEKTNEPYAIAKIAGIKMCESYNHEYQTNFISVMPTNLYGPGDNFDLDSSHVLAALIRKIHEANFKKQDKVILWGTGKPKREFLYVDDLAAACVFLMENYEAKDLDGIINIGTGIDLSILDLAKLIKNIIGFQGEIEWDRSKPDGTPQKLLNVDKIQKLGWKHKINLEEGIKMTYEWFLENKEK